ncbi:hypothetical protein HGA11_16470 [Mycolicibacterium septicum DSM 44393]|uniref:Uncharacterized protein n=1 Tax=Mycolicibacterium septicum DSM 44393 TaxID=1341646 RepID=A0A7X6RWX8_9MYCO|nr:hypothetical protein [Mycolicibacterium septicum]NKZ12577.1 hypothetical protein [Mycolicibacterium septicum DSM 44393]
MVGTDVVGRLSAVGVGGVVSVGVGNVVDGSDVGAGSVVLVDVVVLV